VDVKDAAGKVVAKGKIHLGLDLQGGTSFLIRLDSPVNEAGEKRTITPSMQEQAVGVIRKRVDQFGVSEPVITPQGADRILVQIPGLDAGNIEQARKQLQQVAKLEFKLVHPQSAQLIPQIEAGTAIIPPGFEIKHYKTDRKDLQGKPVEEQLLVKQKADLGGEHVTTAHAFFGNQGYGVSLSLDKSGASKFGDLTKQVFEEKSQLAIVLDGEVQSAPGVHEGPIYGGNAQITGHFDAKQATDLASVLENPLQTPVVIEETRSASSTLGSDSIRSGVYAGVGGLLLVLVFVVVYYQLAGLVAICGLLVNIILLFGVMSMFNFVLTLPGIAGIILTIGLAVDANVLIYERLREEMALGKSLATAIESAYDKAFTVIFDANATTLITAAILFWQATGPVKGFAVTLTVGIITSVFSAMVVTRTLFSWMLRASLLQRISMLHIIPTGKNFDFLGKRFMWIGLSLTVIVISIVGFGIRGEKNFGIDFKGGDILMLEAKTPVSEGDVREALKALELGETVIQKESEPAVKKEYISIRSPFNTSDRIEAHLQKVMPQAGFTEHKKDKVGKLVGGELAKTSLLALGLGMLGILIYVTARFEFSFAIGALVALLHDIIITVGLFAIFGRELSLVMVGAILTIAGYSINDTIVVYDRIREGLHSGRKGSIQSIMNASINETLSRTLLTSGCTLLSVAALFFFGGPVLHDFAFAILIGIVVGTYSSIFIASPIVLWWSGRKGESLKSEVVKSQAAAT
jgi:SecD/SecF fusion protein